MWGDPTINPVPSQQRLRWRCVSYLASSSDQPRSARHIDAATSGVPRQFWLQQNKQILCPVFLEMCVDLICFFLFSHSVYTLQFIMQEGGTDMRPGCGESAVSTRRASVWSKPAHSSDSHTDLVEIKSPHLQFDSNWLGETEEPFLEREHNRYESPASVGTFSHGR